MTVSKSLTGSVGRHHKCVHRIGHVQEFDDHFHVHLPDSQQEQEAASVDRPGNECIEHRPGIPSRIHLEIVALVDDGFRSTQPLASHHEAAQGRTQRSDVVYDAGGQYGTEEEVAVTLDDVR